MLGIDRGPPRSGGKIGEVMRRAWRQVGDRRSSAPPPGTSPQRSPLKPAPLKRRGGARLGSNARGRRFVRHSLTAVQAAIPGDGAQALRCDVTCGYSPLKQALQKASIFSFPAFPHSFIRSRSR